MNFRSHFEVLMIEVDIGGHPPIPFEPSPFFLSVFHFQHKLFLSFFRVLNFRSRFEALNVIFWENQERHKSYFDVSHIKSFIPWLDIYNEVLSPSNRDRMPKLRPRKLKHQFTQTGPIVLALHLLQLGFWMFMVFNCFSTINRPSSLVVTQFRGM